MEVLISSIFKKCYLTLKKLKLNGYYFDRITNGWDVPMIDDDNL